MIDPDDYVAWIGDAMQDLVGVINADLGDTHSISHAIDAIETVRANLAEIVDDLVKSGGLLDPEF